MSFSSLRLYCLPYAGSSASVYVRWKRRLPAWIEVVPVELPGRGRRLDEPLENTVSGVLDRIASGVRPAPGQAFALFGHSLGAILAFELAHRLERDGLAPAAVFVSGTRAPGSRDLERYARVQTDAELRAELERLGGTPASVLADPELMALALPVLRADFRVAGSYTGDPERRLRAPLVALGGTADETTRDMLAAWRDHTDSEFAMHVLPGGHFFIHSSEGQVLSIIEHRLRLLSSRLFSPQLFDARPIGAQSVDARFAGARLVSAQPLGRQPPEAPSTGAVQLVSTWRGPLTAVGRENDGSLGRG